MTIFQQIYSFFINYSTANFLIPHTCQVVVGSHAKEDCAPSVLDFSIISISPGVARYCC